MDSLGNILSDRKLNEPPEIKLIKDYVKSEFNSIVKVISRENHIVVTASSSSLTNTLRLSTVKLQTISKTNKKLVFRTGNIA